MYFTEYLCVFTRFSCFGSPRGGPGGPRSAPEGPRGPPDAPGGPKWSLLDASGVPKWAPPGVLLDFLRRSRGALDGSSRLMAAPRALPGRFWRSPGAFLGRFGALGPHSRTFSFRKSVCFGVLRHRNRNRKRLFVFSFGSFRSTWALALVSRAWVCPLESWALARGSSALAWGHGL